MPYYIIDFTGILFLCSVKVVTACLFDNYVKELPVTLTPKACVQDLSLS